MEKKIIDKVVRQEFDSSTEEELKEWEEGLRYAIKKIREIRKRKEETKDL